MVRGEWYLRQQDGSVGAMDIVEVAAAGGASLRILGALERWEQPIQAYLTSDCLGHRPAPKI